MPAPKRQPRKTIQAGRRPQFRKTGQKNTRIKIFYGRNPSLGDFVVSERFGQVQIARTLEKIEGNTATVKIPLTGLHKARKMARKVSQPKK